MSVVSALAVIALVYGSITAVSPLLQLRRIRQVRSSRDVSMANLAIFWVSFAVWGSYGAALGNLPMTFVNGVALVSMSATLGVALHYRHQHQAKPPEPVTSES